jgi:predicted GNAT family N-acyltransferase
LTIYPQADGFSLMIQEGGEAPEAARLLRNRVFIEEQQVSEEEEYDGLDVQCSHYVLLKGEIPVATARIRPSGSTYKLERMAVAADWRMHGFGKKLVEHMLAESRLSGKEVYLHAQLQAAGFYEKLGFIPVGPHFEEAAIIHVKMRRKL